MTEQTIQLGHLCPGALFEMVRRAEKMDPPDLATIKAVDAEIDRRNQRGKDSLVEE